MNKNDLVQFVLNSVESEFSIPTYDHAKLHQKTITEITSAWNNGAFLDDFGRVWLNSDYLHTIIRTSYGNAKYLIGGLEPHEKYFDGVFTYIRGSSVFYLLDVNLQSAQKIKREHYIRFSESFYQAIRDCNFARILRAEHYENISNSRRKLKNQRTAAFNIKFDELTDEPLNYRSSEFSHIRSFSMYPEISLNILNGLIVNKTTHDIITSSLINDEAQLYDLCSREQWSTNWYEIYLNFLKSIE